MVFTVYHRYITFSADKSFYFLSLFKDKIFKKNEKKIIIINDFIKINSHVVFIKLKLAFNEIRF